MSLTDCDREPIHLLGHVQDFGFLLALTSDWVVARASANVQSYIAPGMDDLIGTPLRTHASADLITALRDEVRNLKGPDQVGRVYRRPFVEGGREFDWAVHFSGDHVVVEAEPSDNGNGVEAVDIPGLLSRLGECEDVPAFAALAAHQVSRMTGFDRVMVYRFAQDGSGEVIAEEKAEHLDESFLDLRYPRTDIPEQARELYKRNTLRIISNVREEPVPIMPPLAANDAPLDLSLSKLRAVSRIHIEYLENMGVDASMSISILIDGQLWGMFVCHHYEPRILSLRLRSAAELYGQLSAFVLDRLIASQRALADRRARRLHDRLMAQVAEGERLDENFTTISDIFRDVIECDGIAILVDRRYQARGLAPSREEFEGLARFLNTRRASRVFQTEHLVDVFPQSADWSSDIAGVLAIPVSRKPRDYIVCFRKEVAQTVTWAGNPQKIEEDSRNGVRLSPRKSFAQWKELVKGRSELWLDSELRAAEQFRVTLLEVVLRLTDAAAVETQKANERQELLIAELNHRVRNILNLIRGLVSQSRSDSDDVMSFSRKIGGRIYALARAHDQVTEQQWSPAPVRVLVETEKEAYLNDKADRVAFNGHNALLAPTAFTTLALVLHELLTNSAKYGALSDSSGRVEIDSKLTEDDDLLLTWREIGGPPVQAPNRKGFGTTIIEKSIPFELGGSAAIEFKMPGVRASFTIPGHYVTGVGEHRETGIKRPEGSADIGGEALIVEDNMIIAMDAEDMIGALGATRIHVASKVGDALNIVDSHDLSFALLDVNLGSGTSEDVANTLHKKGVPFVFATGYGEAHGLLEAYPDIPVLQKPIDQNALAEVVRSALGG